MNFPEPLRWRWAPRYGLNLVGDNYLHLAVEVGKRRPASTTNLSARSYGTEAQAEPQAGSHPISATPSWMTASTCSGDWRREYSLLLEQSALTEAVPVIQQDWKTPFRVSGIAFSTARSRGDGAVSPVGERWFAEVLERSRRGAEWD